MTTDFPSARAATNYLYSLWIGKRVVKESNKPFKSKLKVNTVKDVVQHPVLGIPAFSFIEDESLVECRQCVLEESENSVHN